LKTDFGILIWCVMVPNSYYRSQMRRSESGLGSSLMSGGRLRDPY